jgi:CheY-like chemotaxis protein
MNPTVLVVDDEASVRKLLRRLLNRWDYDIREASDATEALEIMFAAPASMILCDVKMPGHDGPWLVERVRARYPTTPIIMLTSAADMDTVLTCKRLGAVDYVLKPFGRDLLRQALERAHLAVASQRAG